MPARDVENTIFDLKDRYGVGTDRELADAIGIDPTAIAAWRRRGRVPERHVVKARLLEGRDVIDNDAKYDEFSIHILSFFIQIMENENRIRPLPTASEDLNYLYTARIFFEFESKIRKEAAKRRARTPEQCLMVLSEYREQFSGRNRLSDLARFVRLQE